VRESTHLSTSEANHGSFCVSGKMSFSAIAVSLPLAFEK